MSLLSLFAPAPNKPQDVYEVDWSNPLTKGLRSLLLFTGDGFYDLVSLNSWTQNGVNVDHPVTLEASEHGPTAFFDNQAAITNNNVQRGNFQEYTFAGIFNLNSTANQEVVTAAGSSSIEVDINSSKLRLVRPGIASIVLANTVLSTNTWYSWGVSYSENTGEYAFYLDGKDDGNGTASSISGSPGFLTLGEDASTNSFKGKMALFAMWDHIVDPEIVIEFHRNPYKTLKPRRRWVPVVIEGGATVSVGLASELSTAFAISRLKQKAVGLSAETDIALATSPAKVTAVGLSTETDTAFSILRSKIKAAGLSTETDSAFSLIISSAVNVGLSDETDSALAINRLKQNPVGLSTETDAALSVGRSKIKIAGLGIETDVAFTISRSKFKALGLSSEVDQALAISSSGSLAVGLASELDVALVIGRLKQQVLGLPTETDLSQPVSKIKTQQAGLSAESDAALAVTGSSGRVVGLATETDLAQSISRIKQRLIGLAPETDVALAITIAGVTVVINTSAKETLKLLAENPTLTLSAENATLTLS